MTEILKDPEINAKTNSRIVLADTLRKLLVNSNRTPLKEQDKASYYSMEALSYYYNKNKNKFKYKPIITEGDPTILPLIIESIEKELLELKEQILLNKKKLMEYKKIMKKFNKLHNVKDK